MPARVVGQQAMHDLCGGGDQYAVAGQGGSQGLRRNKAVLAVGGVDSGLDTASPGFPDHLAHVGRAFAAALLAITPRLLQRGNRAVVQRGRPQGR